ncbi:Ca(2+)/calmodulin-responsive adenylate cyclase, partial [Drosophila busckii]|uniref:Ca(2+)/calmodulin-responsive adenylate cyclase n=1 Tax=Drosophila busckii TaxID=30019 RepID=UPI001432FDBC
YVCFFFLLLKYLCVSNCVHSLHAHDHAHDNDLTPTHTTNKISKSNENKTTTTKQIMPMQHAPKYDPPRYTCPNSMLSLQQPQPEQQQQRQYALYSQQPPLPQLPPKPALRSYLKPLPKLPTDLEESREMSSTDDLSSRPHSPSMSSSDESYSKTTEGEGDADEDSPRINGGHLQRPAGLPNGVGFNGHVARVNPLQWLYPCDIQVDPSSPDMQLDMQQLRDFELSSTTESHGQQTTSNTTSNTTQPKNGGDSCNSFDYQKAAASQAANGATAAAALASKSPFERELQRLLNESSRGRCLNAANSTEHASSNGGGRNLELSYSASNSKLSSLNGHHGQLPAATTGGSNGNLSGGSNSNSGNNNNSSSSSSHHQQQQQQHKEQLEAALEGKLPVSNSFMISKHPVGLDAIKEITRHKNPSESSQMQTSDTESCEILHETRNQLHALALLELNAAAKEQQQQQQQPQRAHRQRPRSKELQQSYESLDGRSLDGAETQQQAPAQRPRHHHHHHHHHHQHQHQHQQQQRQEKQQQQQQQRFNHVEQDEHDDTEDNLADEEFEDDEVGRDVRQKQLKTHEQSDKQAEQQLEQQSELSKENESLANGRLRLESNVINDELKYGAAHHNHQSMDSNPLESQSEWSDDDCREEATGGAESTGYITDEPGLENISLLNEAGLTDAEGALSDVNSLYNAPDVDDTSVSSRASSRLLSLDSLSGLYDCDLDSKHELAIVNASHKITKSFGPPSSPASTATAQQSPQHQQQQQQQQKQPEQQQQQG